LPAAAARRHAPDPADSPCAIARQRIACRAPDQEVHDPERQHELGLRIEQVIAQAIAAPPK